MARSDTERSARTAAAEPPPVALGPLPGYVGYALRRAQFASFRHLEQTGGHLELTPGQFSLLTFLAANPGISQKTLSGHFGVDSSTLSPVLESLATRGIVRRARADHDRRTYALALTDEGAALLAEMRRCVEAQERLMEAVLAPGEREALLSMLKRITDALNRAV